MKPLCWDRLPLSEHGGCWGDLLLKEAEASVSENGGQVTRERYFSCWERDNAPGYALIEQGSEAWLRLAARLVADAEGCYAMALHSSIALAALKNPIGVLRLVGSGNNLKAADVCMPFVPDETNDEKIKQQIDTLSRLESAFESVHEREVMERKSECLAQILPLKRDLETTRSSGGSPSRRP